MDFGTVSLDLLCSLFELLESSILASEIFSQIVKLVLQASELQFQIILLCHVRVNLLLQLGLLFFDVRDHVAELVIESGLIHISLR